MRRWRLWLLMAPALALLLAIFAAPLMHYLWLSTQAQSVLTGLKPVPIGAQQWLRLWNDGRFWQDTWQTLRFSAASVSLEMLLGLAVALLLHQPLCGRSLLRTISLLPWALPTTVMALGWRWIFNDPYGPINQLLAVLGLGAMPFLSNPNITWLAAVGADTWKTTPFVALLLLAGLQTIPSDLYEAAALEGATAWQSLRRITLPLLTPYLLIAVLFRLAQALGVFDLIQVLTGGGPAGSTESLALYAYLNAMRFLDFGYSATLLLGSFAILLLLCGTAALVWRWSSRLQGELR
ncbi:MAG: sugar ABC transporter permease [Cyanobacteria bacterium M_surface_7_m2_037]|nr:sugar ABC transporter permease [Cyanobacteria bacterium M_surface_7_m2_037]